MKRLEFEEWLKEAGYQPNVVHSRVSNCETVCTYEGDLDVFYEADQCADLLRRLSYSSGDERNNRPTKHKIPIHGNKRTGSATLKQAVTLYVKFRNNENITVRSIRSSNISNTRFNGKDIELIKHAKEIVQLVKTNQVELSEETFNFFNNIVLENEKSLRPAKIELFEKLFGNAPKVGDSISLLDYMKKTFNTKAFIERHIKLWAEKGIIVEYEEDKINDLNSLYVIKALPL